MTDDDSILAKATSDKIRWLENLWKRWIQAVETMDWKKEDSEFFGTSMDMIFARSLDLADKYLCQFIQGIFPFLRPPGFFPFLQAPTSPPIGTLILP